MKRIPLATGVGGSSLRPDVGRDLQLREAEDLYFLPQTFQSVVALCAHLVLLHFLIDLH